MVSLSTQVPRTNSKSTRREHGIFGMAELDRTLCRAQHLSTSEQDCPNQLGKLFRKIEHRKLIAKDGEGKPTTDGMDLLLEALKSAIADDVPVKINELFL